MERLRGQLRRLEIAAASASTAFDVCPVASNKIIVVTAIGITSSAAISIQLRNKTTTANVLTGALHFPINGWMFFQDPEGLFASLKGEAIEATRSGTAVVGGFVVYKLLDG